MASDMTPDDVLNMAEETRRIKQSLQQAAFDIEFGQDLSPRLLIVTCLSINWWLKHARPTPTF